MTRYRLTKVDDTWVIQERYFMIWRQVYQFPKGEYKGKDGALDEAIRTINLLRDHQV